MGKKSISAEDAIVVVDDTENFALCVKTFLQFEGYEGVKIFNCPGKALDDIRQYGCPAFIISDYEMPLMSGAVFLDSIMQQYPQAQGVIITCHYAVPAEVASRFTVIRKDDEHFFDRLLSCLQKALVSEKLRQ